MTQRLPLAFILAVVVIDAAGVGLIMPVMPDLLREVMDSSLAEAALWGGVLTTSFAAMQFLFSPGIGALSDRFGRRPVLLISLAIVTVDYLVMGVAWTIWLLLFARLIAGLASSTVATAGAFMADISKEKDKAANFGLLGAAMGAGLVLGPVVGGLLGQFGTRAPFFAAALFAAASFAVGLRIMPETVRARNRRAFLLSSANPFGALRELAALPGLARLFLFYFVYEFAFMVYPAVWAFYTAARFDWGPGMIGLSLAIYGLAVTLVQALLVRPVLRLLGERRAIVWGILADIAALLVLGSLTDPVLLLIATPVAALGAIVMPAIQAVMSRRAGKKRQGSLQGVMTSIRSLAAFGAPVVMTGVFAWFTHDDTALYLPGAPFYLAAVLALTCLGIFATTPRKSR